MAIRRSDLVKLGWRNLVGDRIEFMSQKGSEKYAPSISLPLKSELARPWIKSRMISRHSLSTNRARRSPAMASETNYPSDATTRICRNARRTASEKTSATTFAEADATEYQLMAIFGWSDSKMAQNSTKAAQSKRTIDAGFERHKAYGARSNVPRLSSRNSGEAHQGKTDGKSTSLGSNGGLRRECHAFAQ
ncbi:hypothetical protein LRX75_20410 [Rhizobium sp. DKSPLA3]|uniref:Uncharacterized protein n=1 Tax=Rhizobium quercicola TaxID=2901226 RepID=A0A9X1NUN0_9HYPH|nr:hypothetical protein [Rhizobium quercicola]MCD7111407.1 hypothetical protein [Rhizobium quercicola]